MRLGTRGSKLALIQAERAKHAFESLGIKVEIKVIHTSGDLDLTSPIYEIGGKGIFIKELEAALLKNEIDVAVHSLKDMTTSLPENLALAAFLKPEAVSDTLVFNRPFQHFDELPENALLATGSMRRKALVKRMRPDIRFIDIRGNVGTRLEKMKELGCDGIILSEAGLSRLGICLPSYKFNPLQFCPAPGQGVIVLETRQGEESLCSCLNDKNQEILSRIELKFLEKIGFDCRVPLGIYARYLPSQKISLLAFLSNGTMDKFLEETVEFEIGEKKAEEMSERFMHWLG